MTEHTETTITQLLRSKYSGRNWAFVSQVPNGTGMNKSRTCDGMAMGLWPSKGLHLHGFEIKVSRGDWLAEIQDPEKAVAFSRYCHFWWIVVPSGIIKPVEVAADWGVQEVTKAGLRVKKAATLRSPELIGVDFLAGLFRACSRESSEAEIKQARQSGFDAGRKAGWAAAEQYGDTDAGRFKREATNLRCSIERFEEASGLSIGQYNGGQIGQLVRQARAINNIEKKLAGMREQVQRIREVLDDDN